MDNNTILMVSKTQTTFSEEEVMDVFSKSDSLDEIAKTMESAEDRLYTSWATVDSVDKEGQKVPIDEAIKQQDILMERGAPIMDTHTNKSVGKTLAYRVLEHPVTKTIGILHLNKIYKNNILDDKVWAETVSGKRKGSSVGGFSTDKQMVSDDGSIFESLKGFNWMETSNVESPCNPHATNHAMSLVAKSEEKMVYKKEVKKEESDVTTETPDVSDSDRISALEEGLGMVISKMDELISATAGTPEVEKEAESDSMEEDKEVEKEEDEEEVEKEDESEEKEESEVAKSLKLMAERMTSIEKSLKVVEVVKSEMPTQVNKAEKEVHSFTDVMKGKVSLNDYTRGQL